MKAALVFIGLFFSWHTLSAQSLKDSIGKFDWVKISPKDSYADFAWENLPEGINRLMVESLLESPYLSSEDAITLFPIQGELYALLPCEFDVLRWSGDSWENLYKGTSSGFNCHAHFFVREGNIYSLGRYGFWQAHSELLIFDFEVGSWNPLQVVSSPNNYAGVGIFVDGNRIYSILGEYIHQPTQQFESDKNGYFFDFDSQTWSPLKLEFPEQSENSLWILPSFDLKDYGIQLYQHKAENGFLLLDKKNPSLYFTAEKDFGKIESFAIAVASENRAVFLDRFGSATLLVPEKNFEKRFKKLGAIEFKERGSTTWWESWGYLLVGIVGGAIFLFGIRKKIRRQGNPIVTEQVEVPGEKETIEGEDYLARMMVRLLAHPTQVVDVHQLDELLGITELESLDYRRVRRSRYIKAVNQQYQVQAGKELIFRTKSEVDKRIVLYRISP